MSMFKSKSVISKVGDTDVEFFSLSFPTLFAMKSAVGPIAKVLSGIFSGRGLTGRFEQTKDGETIINQQALTPEMFKLRAEQSAATMRDAVEAIFSDQNRLLVGRILMDSMRGLPQCPRKPSVPQIEEFLADLDLGQIIEMLNGVAKANAEVFGPLVQGWLRKAQSQLRDRALSASPIGDASEANAPVPSAPPSMQLMPKD